MALMEQTVAVNVRCHEIEPRVYAVQADTGRSIRCVIRDWDIPEGATAKVYVRKISGKIVYNVCEVDRDTNSVLIQVTSQMIAEAGEDNLAMVEITSNDECVTTFAFYLVVKYKFGSEEESKNESTWVDELMQKYIEEAEKLNQDTRSATEEAESSAEEARNSASDAAESASQAEDAKNTAKDEADRAKEEADRAEAAAERAETAADKAETSETNAAESAEQASDSADTVLEESEKIEERLDRAESLIDTTKDAADRAEKSAAEAAESAETAKDEADKAEAAADAAEKSGIKSAKVYYQAGDSGTIPPEGEWETEIPSVESGHFLWVRVTITYNNEEELVYYNVSKMGSETGIDFSYNDDSKTLVITL